MRQIVGKQPLVLVIGRFEKLKACRIVHSCIDLKIEKQYMNTDEMNM